MSTEPNPCVALYSFCPFPGFSVPKHHLVTNALCYMCSSLSSDGPVLASVSCQNPSKENVDFGCPSENPPRIIDITRGNIFPTHGLWQLILGCTCAQRARRQASVAQAGDQKRARVQNGNQSPGSLSFSSSGAPSLRSTASTWPSSSLIPSGFLISLTI